MKKRISPTTTFKGTIDEVSIREVINFRVWWKPKTIIAMLLLRIAELESEGE